VKGCVGSKIQDERACQKSEMKTCCQGVAPQCTWHIQGLGTLATFHFLHLLHELFSPWIFFFLFWFGLVLVLGFEPKTHSCFTTELNPKSLNQHLKHMSLPVTVLISLAENNSEGV
jgi:hypothetical protein